MALRNAFWLSADSAPALGDIRLAGAGCIFYLMPGVTERRDWGRYQDALGQAISRGAEVAWPPRCVGCGEVNGEGCTDGRCCR